MDKIDPEFMETDTERKISTQACNVLNELRQNGQLCDAIIRVEGGQFPVHRAIMSACSPYFRALFTNGMHETDQREVYIPGVAADMMGLIIEFAYTRDSNVTAENVERLLPAADQFHVLGLTKACCQYLANNLEPENCIGIRNFARHYFCTGLERTSQRYIMEHFCEVAAQNNEILTLSLGEFKDIVNSDDLNAKTEETVFDTVIRWMNYDPQNRKDHMLELMKCVRLGLLSTEYFLEKVKVHPFVRDSDECRPLVIETLKFLYHLDTEEGQEEIDFSHPLARPRVPHEILFVLGGWSGGSPTNIIETYDTRADRWIMTEQENLDKAGPRAYHGCATVGGLIYVIGGFDGMDYFNSVRCFNPANMEWCEVAPMNARRCYVSVAVLGGHVYAMGGFDGHARQNTAERYTPQTNQWSLVHPMNFQRSDAKASTMGGKIYIAGGFNGQECLNSAEYYDPSTNQWTSINAMRNRRSGVGVIVHQGFLYAIGGFNGITRMNNGERWNPETNTWANIAEMYSPRSNYAIEIIDDMIFVIGGFNGVTTIDKVECYEPTGDEWFDCTDMNIFRSALSACVVRGLPNVRDFIQKDRDKALESFKKGRFSERTVTPQT